MNTVEILNHYLHAAERRLKMFALSRGAAVTAIVALALTVVLCIVLNAFTFSPGVLLVSRILLFVSLAVAVSFGVVMPLLRMNRRNTARRMEQRYPEFQQRLLTFAERRDAESNPFIGLLAAETADVAKRAEPARVAPGRALLTWLASGAGAAVVLIWLIVAGPGYFGHGASLLWAGPSKSGPASLYDIQVSPGDQTVRRRTDQLITARLIGFDTKNVRLMAKFQGTSKWEEVTMQPAPGDSAYEFLFAALHDSVEYYVEARGFRSRTHTISVIDLPGIKGFKVTYKYPAWTGMKPAVEDPGGDLRAVEGTVAELSVETEAPLKNASVFIDDGTQVQLTGDGTTLLAQVPIKKDGMYHFAAMDGSKPVRLSEDYFIEARADNVPALKLTRPGRDAKVSPIEEVVLAVQAEDDYGLQDLKLHYSVNGGEEKTVDLLSRKGTKQAEGSTMLALEDFKLVPGDVVTVYATARDARNVTQTDMYFLEAQPFEREFTQSQQAGGGGGGGEGEQPGQISARQKEIIAATWNQIKGKSTAQEAAENARFLTEVQAKLRDQANSMSQRAKSRALAGVNQEFQSFVKSMDEAVKEMSAATEKLNKSNWKEALPIEQRALQHALRAEAVFREIQVAFGQQGGGGGGGAARDLDNLFDLELDTEKNQYETGQQTASSEQREKEIDEALQKLEQLARRQQELARQQQNQKQQSFQQRWEQEQLRREAEELRKKMDQLQRGSQQGQQSASSQQQSGQQGQQGQQSGQQSGQQGQQGQQSARGGQQGQQQQNQRLRQMSGQSPSEQRLKQAFDRLSQAAEDMRQAASQGDQSNAGARRAAERLQEAKDMLRGLRQQQSNNQLDDLSQRADELAAQQHEFANKMRRAFGAGQSDPRAPSLGNRPQQQPNWSDLQQLAGEKDKMARDMESLERDTQKAARDLAGSQPAASSKLREGLGAIQQDEVRLRMKLSSQWIRQGRGSYLVPGEAVSAMALDKLSDSIKDARKALGEGGGKQPDNETEKALARVERMREQLERAAAGQRGQQQGGQQGGQQQGGQQQGGQQQGGQQQGGQQQGGQQQGGQQGGQQQGGQQQGGQQGGQQQGGQQQGGQQQGGQQGGQQQGGQQGGQMQAGGYRGGERMGGNGSLNRGNLGDRPGDYPINRGVDPERALRETVRDLSQLRQSLGANSELGREISDVLRDIQRSDYPLAGNELGARLEREVLPAIEQLEMQLRRKVEGDTAATRTPAADKIPAGYGEKVADYFRRLSKSR